MKIIAKQPIRLFEYMKNDLNCLRVCVCFVVVFKICAFIMHKTTTTTIFIHVTYTQYQWFQCNIETHTLRCRMARLPKYVLYLP